MPFWAKDAIRGGSKGLGNATRVNLRTLSREFMYGRSKLHDTKVDGPETKLARALGG